MKLCKLDFLWWVFVHPIGEFKSLEMSIRFKIFKLSKFFDFDIQLFGICYYLFININTFGLLDFHISYNNKGDHAGFRFNIGILGLCFEFNICDIRHWNFDQECWEKLD